MCGVGQGAEPLRECVVRVRVECEQDPALPLNLKRKEGLKTKEKNEKEEEEKKKKKKKEKKKKKKKKERKKERKKKKKGGGQR